MNSEHLNYHHLRYFWMVAKYGSMTQAADQAGLRPQTLSSQVRALELSLGRSLFKPQGRGLVLTEAGLVALRYADQIFQIGDQLVDSLQDENLDSTMRLTLGIADALPKPVCYSLLAPVLDKHPVRLVCKEGQFTWLCSELSQHRIDLVLAERPGGQGTAQLQSRSLSSFPVQFFANHPLTAKYGFDLLEVLQTAPILLPSRGNMLRIRLEQWFDSLDIKPHVVGEFDDLALMEVFGRKGVGVFPMPSSRLSPNALDEGLDCLGEAEGVIEQYFAFVHPRSVDHPLFKDLFKSD